MTNGIEVQDYISIPTTKIKSVTVGLLARQFGLSRSTLLYYDSIGLLHPSGRSPANYRKYTHADVCRLQQICMYRQMGLSLSDIARAPQAPQSHIKVILERRLAELDEEVRSIREQQQVILRLLKDESLRDRLSVMNKERWTDLLKAAGLDEGGMRKWHQEFELRFPQSHQQFLEELGIPDEEIRSIRRWCQDDWGSPSHRKNRFDK